ncbi:MAG: NACHT and WD repeat domain-containing protein, partial [Syntrophothermus sp.]
MNTMISNPYVGPRTFLESERDRFFGRDREARDLLALVVSEPLVLFYAQSGAGKSSLVNTRLIPDLRKRGFSIITGRVGGDAPAGMEVENVFVFNLVRSLAPKEVDSVTLAAISLKDFLCNVLLNKPPDRGQETPFSKKRVLIIDQFEEIFRIHHEAWEKREDFFVQLAEAMEADPYLWVVLVMREDFTASLDSYLHLLPGRLRMRYYMQRLERASALEAIKKPVTEMRPYEEGVAEKLVDDLRSVKVFKPDGTPDMQPGQYVEPVQLQVVCSNLWQNLPPNGRTITIQDIQDVGDVDTSLGNYYADRVKAAAASYHIKEWKIREWFSKKLISPGGIRNMVLMDPTGKTDGLENHVIQSLSDLIRTEQRGGGVFYELTHDRLVKPILANNEKWENQHLNLLQRGAVLWSARDRSEDVLLRGRELIKAENEARNIELTDLEEAYLNASRRMRSQENKERKQKRLLFLLAVGALIAMCAAFSLFLVSMGLLNRSNTQLNQMQSLRLALVSKILLGNDVDSNPEVAALLSIRSLDEMYIPEADSALVDSMDRLYAVHTFVGHQKGIRSIAVSSDGNQLATGSDDSTIKIWNIQNGDLIRTLEGHTSWIGDLAFSPDGKTLLSGSFDNTAIIWDLASGKPLFTLEG